MDRLFTWLFDKILPPFKYPIYFDNSIGTIAWKWYGGHDVVNRDWEFWLEE